MSETRRALITGASSGIGREIGRILAKRGFRLVVTARRLDRLDQLAGELRDEGAEVHVVAADLGEPDTPARLIEACRTHLGGLDILVNNAGYGLPHLFVDSDPAAIRHQIEVNVTAPIVLARLAIPMLAAGRGIIINVGSSMSAVAIPAFGVYGMTKAAIAYWNDALRRELRGRGVRVCLVEPGPIGTEFLDVVEAGGGSDREAWLMRPPSFVNGRADDAAARIVRLIDRPRRRISMLRRVVWPLRVAGVLLSVFPGIGDRLLTPRKGGKVS